MTDLERLYEAQQELKGARYKLENMKKDVPLIVQTILETETRLQTVLEIRSKEESAHNV